MASLSQSLQASTHLHMRFRTLRDMASVPLKKAGKPLPVSGREDS